MHLSLAFYPAICPTLSHSRSPAPLTVFTPPAHVTHVQEQNSLPYAHRYLRPMKTTSHSTSHMDEKTRNPGHDPQGSCYEHDDMCLDPATEVHVDGVRM